MIENREIISRKHVMSIVLSLELSDSNLYFYTVLLPSYHCLVTPASSAPERKEGKSSSHPTLHRDDSERPDHCSMAGCHRTRFIQLATHPSELPRQLENGREV